MASSVWSDTDWILFVAFAAISFPVWGVVPEGACDAVAWIYKRIRRPRA